MRRRIALRVPRKQNATAMVTTPKEAPMSAPIIAYGMRMEVSMPDMYTLSCAWPASCRRRR